MRKAVSDSSSRKNNRTTRPLRSEEGITSQPSPRGERKLRRAREDRELTKVSECVEFSQKDQSLTGKAKWVRVLPEKKKNQIVDPVWRERPSNSSDTLKLPRCKAHPPHRRIYGASRKKRSNQNLAEGGGEGQIANGLHAEDARPASKKTKKGSPAVEEIEEEAGDRQLGCIDSADVEQSLLSPRSPPKRRQKKGQVKSPRTCQHTKRGY